MKQEPVEFRIDGMDCAEEVEVLRKEIGPLVGGAENLAFNILNSKMSCPPSSDPAKIIAAVAKAGLSAVEWKSHTPADPRSNDKRQTRLLVTGASGVLLLGGLLSHAYLHGSFREALIAGEGTPDHDFPVITKVAYLAATLAGAWFFLPKAATAARRLRPDMNLLMVIAVCGAIAIGEWFEAATVSFLFAVSLLLESWSVARARRAISDLLDITPPTISVVREDGSVVERAPADVAVGTIFLVKPGERIALDGAIVDGESQVNQAPITGESIPVPKRPGDAVYAGTINGDDSIHVRSLKLATDTALAHILKLVEESQSRRASSEQWVERFARIYTPVVMFFAAAIWLVPPILLNAAWSDWTYRALVLLVIACPCALVISTPVSVVAGLATAARNGVLIKGGLYLELPAKIDAMAFDKTGTLTKGDPQVLDIIPLGPHDETALIRIAASLESQSDHPIARAIRRHAEMAGVPEGEIVNHRIVSGRGSTATFDKEEYWLGSHRYLEERGQETELLHQQVEGLSRLGRTVVVIGTGQHVCGVIGLADEVRPEAKDVVRELGALGVSHLAMLTGDNAATAAKIASQAGIIEVHSGLLPQDKVVRIEQLVNNYGKVSMVGDGINDAPAMARSSLGIAMGAIGSDAAIETADIALMSDDLRKIPWLIGHSRRTLRIIRQNVSFSLGTKGVFVGLTLMGHASLWAAITADLGASLLVIMNGLRLLREEQDADGS